MRYTLPVVISVFLQAICLQMLAQCPSGIDITNAVSAIEKNKRFTAVDKLEQFYQLKNKIVACKLVNDTSQALLLLKLGKYEFIANKNYNRALEFTKTALRLNSNAPNGGSHSIALNITFNIAFYYQSLFFYPKALAYYDTTILFCKKYGDDDGYEIDIRKNKSDIYFLTGDYQKAVDEALLGMHTAVLVGDSSAYMYCLNRKAQSLCIEGQLPMAEADAITASKISISLKDTFELATSFKTLGLIYERQGKLQAAESYYKSAVTTRTFTHDNRVIASDYNDLGNFYLNALKNTSAAKVCYAKTIAYAQQMPDTAGRQLKLAMAYVNLAAVASQENKWSIAAENYMKASALLGLGSNVDIGNNPAAARLAAVANKDLVVVLMSQKTSLLLEKYKISQDRIWLNSCIATAKVTDSMLSMIRFEHVGELSKLFWRDKTREFYDVALEAAWLKADAELGFYFMEKSKAVLLNDKLNENSASMLLPASALAEEERLQMDALDMEAKLAAMKNNSVEYETQHAKLLLAKDQYQSFIKTLEQKYPTYYRSKYEDAVTPLKNVLAYLDRTGQSLIHCFVQDTALFVLSIAGKKVLFKRLALPLYDKLQQFNRMCSSSSEMNANYPGFLALSNEIYKSLFAPLQIPKGRVIVSLDKIVIPFEALVSDVAKKHFLLEDYAFSYVYSFRTILSQTSNKKAKGNFLGVAPVSFSPMLHLPALQGSSDAVVASSSSYSSTKIITNKAASKSNFLDLLPSYSVVNIFSHASADTNFSEPYLFMADSSIALSQLQQINEPATSLVVLSACETNAGRSAVGEGVYSLARGFYMAGIPSVAATLWKADEEVIYAITGNFNRNLVKGMSKDVALQQAKLEFLKTVDGEKALPCYWANLIIVGNTEPVVLSKSYKWWWIGGAGLLIVLLVVSRWHLSRQKS